MAYRAQIVATEGCSRKGGAQPDTRQYFDAKGNITRRELDTDGDGISDRRLRYGANSHLVGMDNLGARSTKAVAAALAR